jgi:hypothetical protein
MVKKTTMWSLMAGLALVSLPLAVMAAGGSPPQSDSAGVAMDIARWVEIVAPDVVGPWGMGHTVAGLPGPAGGDHPLFVGGTAADHWRTDGTRPWANGAVARSPLAIKTNCQWAAQVVPTNISLLLTGGGGAALPCVCQIGKPSIVDGTIWLYNDTDNVGEPPTGNAGALNWWLYALVKRDGLNDAAGHYVAVTSVEVYSQSDWTP